jgi:hypothetical protein
VVGALFDAEHATGEGDPSRYRRARDLWRDSHWRGAGDEGFNVRMHERLAWSMRTWTAALVLIALATAAVVALLMSRGASAGARQTDRYTDYLGGSSTHSTQCTASPGIRHGGWTCYVPPAP